MHNDVGPGLSFLIYRNFCNCSKSRRNCILILEFFKTIILDLFKKVRIPELFENEENSKNAYYCNLYILCL